MLMFPEEGWGRGVVLAVAAVAAAVMIMIVLQKHGNTMYNCVVRFLKYFFMQLNFNLYI